MKKLVILVLLFCSLTAYKNNTETQITTSTEGKSEKKYEGNGFSFNYPKDWKITDKEAIDEDIFYLAIEKNGSDASGLITITSFDYLIDLDDTIKLNIEEFENNSFIKKLKFTPTTDDEFNTITSRSASFTFSSIGIKHKGIVHAFDVGEKSYVILKQEALEDTKANKKGFDLIENSFSSK